MTVRVGINGFGRIGRDVLRAAVERHGSPIEIVAVNDIMPPETCAHLLRYDSTYGPWRVPISVNERQLEINGRNVRVTAEPDPAKITWDDLDVEVVIESTGRFRTREQAAAHLNNGVRKVIVSAPGRGVDATIVMGVNDDEYDASAHHVVSNASCTTNCVAPMVSVLHRTFGIRYGLMTTIHSYTNDQSLLDGPHKDPRRARSAAVNLIPTTTGAAKAVGEVIPPVAGILDGVAVRVPVEDGSITDLAVQLDTPATPGQINRAFATAAASYLKGILRYTEEPVVSRDIIGDPASCVFDAGLTTTRGDLAKVFGWYDNEWGYAERTVDLAEKIAILL